MKNDPPSVANIIMDMKYRIRIILSSLIAVLVDTVMHILLFRV